MKRSGFATWAGLYLSGVLLVVFVLAHIVAVHYAGDVMAEGYTFENVTERMRGDVYPFLNLALLTLALFHGLFGLHRFVGDLAFCGERALRVTAGILLAVGLWGFYYGVRIFLAFTMRG